MKKICCLLSFICSRVLQCSTWSVYRWFYTIQSYSGSLFMWPIFITPYNLPTKMCMKEYNIFLTLVIPGPWHPGRNIDVYLRPLVDELRVLRSDGIHTYDVPKKQNFVMRAALMWTISDFSTYGMLSGWSTHKKLACPYCMKNTKSFQLGHSDKCLIMCLNYH